VRVVGQGSAQPDTRQWLRSGEVAEAVGDADAEVVGRTEDVAWLCDAARAATAATITRTARIPTQRLRALTREFTRTICSIASIASASRVRRDAERYTSRP